jgi:glycerol-3-phosphate cytidylyltransferase-like family protein
MTSTASPTVPAPASAPIDPPPTGLPPVSPTVQLTQTAPRIFSTIFTTINGRPCILAICEEVNGQKRYGSLEKPQWEKVTEYAQRIFLKTAQKKPANTPESKTYVDLTSSDIGSIEIPLENSAASIRYQKVDAEDFKTLSASQMAELRGVSSTNHYDHMKALRQAWKTPHHIHPDYLTTRLSPMQQAHRNQKLIIYMDAYKDKHPHIQALRMIENKELSEQKDISLQTYETLRDELLEHKAHFMKTEDLKTTLTQASLKTEAKKFVMTLEDEHGNPTYGIYIDPKHRRVFIYNAGQKQPNISKHPMIASVIAHLNSLRAPKDPVWVYEYSQADEASEKPKELHSKRHLLCFLHAMTVSGSKTFAPLYQQHHQALKDISSNIADGLLAKSHRYHERLYTLGIG